MHLIKKEIDALYYLDITTKYVVINDKYNGIIVMDFSFNIIRYIELEEDFIIEFSAKNKDEMLLLCYEHNCAFYVCLENGIARKFSLEDFKHTYFLDIYFWKDNVVYLFAEGGEVCVEVDLNNLDITRFSRTEITNSEAFNKYLELTKKRCLSYDHNENLALFVQNSNYYVFDLKSKKTTNLNIISLKQDENLSSDQIYVKTVFSMDNVISMSERKIIICSKEHKKQFIYPPYEIYRFFDINFKEYNGKKMIFVLSYDNSAEGSTLLLRYDSFDKS